MKNKLLLLFLLPLCFTGCLNTTPKDFGTTKTIKVTPVSTNSLDNFAISYAAKNSADTEILVQGAAGTSGAFTSTCSATGSSCFCEFYDSSNTLLGTNDSQRLVYDSSANQARCTIPSTIVAANISSVLVRNVAGTKTTSKQTLTALASLTLKQILAGLSADFARTIYRYRCDIQYLQKNLTTTSTFDCIDQGVTDLSLIRVRYNNYLFADSFSNNFSSQFSDFLYTNLCGMQLKKVVCTSIDSSTEVLSKDFGLYAKKEGVFTIPIVVNSGPQLAGSLSGSSYTIGFAAPVSTLDATCPPGFIKKGRYLTAPASGETQAAFKDTGSAGATDNNASDIADTVILNFTSAAFNQTVKRTTGGDCGGTTCTVPTTDAGDYDPNGTKASILDYTISGSAFCAISSSFLQ